MEPAPPPGSPPAGCEELPSWGYPLGIVMGIFGSIGINIGQNLQASGLQALPEKDRVKPMQSVVWRIGLGIFILFSLVNFAALALAPASILTPMESIQFVTNVVWNRFVNHKAVNSRMLTGVCLTVIGTVLSVVFGAAPSGCHTLAELQEFWASGMWWVYFAVTLSTAAVAHAGHEAYLRRQQRRVEQGSQEALPANAAFLLPIAYTLASSLAGGAQMIVHSKVVSELLSMLVQGDVAVFSSWLLYVEVLLVTVCGVLWAWRLTACLALYEPLLILPLMVGSYVLFGGIAGGIFFHEFSGITNGIAGPGGAALFAIGMLLVLLGLFLIADASVQPPSVKPTTDAVMPPVASPAGLVAPPSSAAAAVVAPLVVSQDPAAADGQVAAGSTVDTPLRAIALQSEHPSPATSSRPQSRTTPQRKANGITPVKELTVEVLSDQERRLARTASRLVSPSASAMPTPTAIILSSARLAAVRSKLAERSRPQSTRPSPLSGTATSDKSGGGGVKSGSDGPKPFGSRDGALILSASLGSSLGGVKEDSTADFFADSPLQMPPAPHQAHHGRNGSTQHQQARWPIGPVPDEEGAAAPCWAAPASAPHAAAPTPVRGGLQHDSSTCSTE